MNTIRKATNYFSDDNKKAEGVFGSIYKGTLQDGREVLVKSLSERFGQNLKEFKKEVFLHSKLQHRNLTEFIGFCLEGEQKLIINEYVPNPSLHYFLTDPERRKHLDWDTQYNIITGIARGMLYIDQDSRHRIVHCNLRPTNILLDYNMNAKISHFGLLVTSDSFETQTDNNPFTFIASYGIMSLEEKIYRDYSIKSNVFCFGVLLLSIISSERYSNLPNFYEINYADELLSEAWKQWRKGTPLDFVDQTLIDQSSRKEILGCMNLGLLCIQESPDERPTMSSVAFILNNSTITDLPAPQEPAFFFRCEEKQRTDEASTTPSTTNSVSISELQPR